MKRPRRCGAARNLSSAPLCLQGRVHLVDHSNGSGHVRPHNNPDSALIRRWRQFRLDVALARPPLITSFNCRRTRCRRPGSRPYALPSVCETSLRSGRSCRAGSARLMQLEAPRPARLFSYSFSVKISPAEARLINYHLIPKFSPRRRPKVGDQ